MQHMHKSLHNLLLEQTTAIFSYLDFLTLPCASSAFFLTSITLSSSISLTFLLYWLSFWAESRSAEHHDSEPDEQNNVSFTVDRNMQRTDIVCQIVKSIEADKANLCRNMRSSVCRQRRRRIPVHLAGHRRPGVAVVAAHPATAPEATLKLWFELSRASIRPHWTTSASLLRIVPTSFRSTSSTVAVAAARRAS